MAPSCMFLVSRWGCVSSFVNQLTGFWGFYGGSLCVVLIVFLFTRVPYFYGLGGFGLFLFGWVSPLFLTLFFSRLRFNGLSSFFSHFVPAGTPLWISPVVALAETVRYIVRPFVLLLRPLLNISIGSFGGLALGYICMNRMLCVFFLLVLFFYEIFVAVVHWFIVRRILSFRENH